MSAISIIIVNWNSAEVLRQCLSALDEQTCPIADIVVVDNASADFPLQDLAARFPKVRFLQLEHNIGFAAANNLAVRSLVQSEWIVLLNPDAFPEPDWLEHLMRAARQHPDHAFFGCRMLMADEPDRLDGVGDSYHVSGLVWREGHGCPAPNNYVGNAEIFSPCAAAAMYRRDVFLEVDGFDEDFFCYVEDVDLGFRLRLAGYRCLYVSDAIVHHVGSSTTGKRSAFSSFHGHRNMVWSYFKNMPGPLFWVYLPHHLLINLASIAWLSAQGQTSIALRAKREALRKLPLMWRKRKHIQATRKASALELRRMMAKGFPGKRACKET